MTDYNLLITIKRLTYGAFSYKSYRTDGAEWDCEWIKRHPAVDRCGSLRLVGYGATDRTQPALRATRTLLWLELETVPFEAHDWRSWRNVPRVQNATSQRSDWSESGHVTIVYCLLCSSLHMPECCFTVLLMNVVFICVSNVSISNLRV